MTVYYCDRGNVGQITESTTFPIVSLDGKYQHINVLFYSFALAVALSDILTFQVFDLEKVCLGHGRLFSN